jgi:putative ABC transport system permease protein
VREVDANVPLADVISMEGLLSTSVAERRFYMFLLGMFATVALLLSVVGIYGVISYSVTQRTQEIGLRVALGARGSDIIRMVIGEAMAMVGIGVTVGILSAALLTRFLKSLLFGVGSHDPLTILAVSLTLSAFALFASYWPARRAMQVDPMIALRSE